MKRVIKIFVVVFLILAVLTGIAMTYFYFNVWNKPFITDKRDRTLYVPSGSDLKTVLDSIAQWPLATDTSSFALIARQKNLHKNINPGRYIVPGKSRINDFINLLRSGAQTPVRMTISNVNNSEELAAKASQYIEATEEEILRAINDKSRPLPDGITHNNLRALFLPNTYEFYWNTNADAWIERMIVEYHKYWTPDRRALAAKIKLTPHEVSVLASIVEKETVKRDEMPKVAGLYLNRLRDNWKLQSDPTVIFAIQITDPTFSPRRVLYDDLKVDSPYNTYKYKGLPPGPITYPSLKALDAVLNAEQHDYFYMCANPDSPGYHSFARNDREHAANKKKYVQWLQKQGIRR
ncbi:MAG: endolytic transglycosylase MltG [Cryomorphaceae bacterium]|nr:endolytic transglycosylase MltG [Cryomorphaceae bacterium]